MIDPDRRRGDDAFGVPDAEVVFNPATDEPATARSETGVRSDPVTPARSADAIRPVADEIGGARVPGPLVAQ